MTDSSGLIIKELVLPREAVDSGDPYSVIFCNIQFVNYLLYTAHYMPDEMAPEPMWSYQVDYYLGQVNNGGHGQYVGNSRIVAGNMELTIEATKRGLAAMGANDYGEIYGDLIALLASNQELAERIAGGGGFGEIVPATRDLDRRFFAIDGSKRLIGQNRAFLLGLNSLRLVSDSEWRGEMERLGRQNPKGQERALAEKRKNEELAAREPRVIIAKELCHNCGRVFVSWTGVNPRCRLEGQRIDGWFMATDKGAAVAFFLSDETLLFKHRRTLPDLFTKSADQVMKYLGANKRRLLTEFHYTRSKDLLAAVKLPRA